MKYTLGLILSALLVLSGCSNDPESYRKRTLEKENQMKSRVTLVTLKDGTRCAIFYDKNGYGGMGGISCDWKHTND